MEKLKIVEKVGLIISFVSGILALVLSVLLDELKGYSGILTSSIIVSPLFGISLIAITLILGFTLLLLFNSRTVTYKLGISFMSIGELLLLLASLSLTKEDRGSVSMYLGLISFIIYALTLVILIIRYCINNKNCDEIDGNTKNQNISAKRARAEILEWKKLMYKKVITEEEFEEKRKSILNGSSNKDDIEK